MDIPTSKPVCRRSTSCRFGTTALARLLTTADDRIVILFAAAHESLVGTFRTFSDVRLESAMRNKADIRQRYEFMSSRPSSARSSQTGPCRLLGAAILDSCLTERSCRAEHPHQTEQYLPRAARPTSPGLPKGRPELGMPSSYCSAERAGLDFRRSLVSGLPIQALRIFVVPRQLSAVS